MNEVKKPWQSKTLWANTILAVASFFPKTKEVLTPEVMSMIFLVANAALRFVTKSAISVK